MGFNQPSWDKRETFNVICTKEGTTAMNRINRVLDTQVLSYQYYHTVMLS